MQKYRLRIILLLILGGTSLLSGCRESPAELARRHCSTCHLFPEPREHTVRSWPVILTRMSQLMGRPDYRLLPPGHPERNGILRLEKYLRGLGRIPKKESAPPAEELRKIFDYYLENALLNLPPPFEPSPTSTIAPVIFRPVPSFRLPGLPPKAWVFPLFQPQPGILLAGDITRSRVYRFALKKPGKKGSELRVRLVESQKLPSPAIKFSCDPVQTTRQAACSPPLRAGLIGSLAPSDVVSGQIALFPLFPRLSGFSLNSQQHYRMADFTVFDLNRDGVTDLILSEFGNYRGRARVLLSQRLPNRPKSLGHPGFQSKVLYDGPGATRARVVDLDKDGREDLLWLISQEQEKLIWYRLGPGAEVQETSVLIQNSPSFGSVDFLLHDFNHDGRADILLVNGDNGDIPGQPPRDYHGLRIYLQREDYQFEQKFFFRFPGALSAIAEDFNKDGLADIALVANFPDKRVTDFASFVLLRNDSTVKPTGAARLNFTPVYYQAVLGREFASLLAFDPDGDGDTDLLLGGRAGQSNKGPLPGSNYLLLRNTTELPSHGK